MQAEAMLSRLLGTIGVPVARKFVRAQGVGTSYLDLGSGDAVVLLHGGDAGAGGIRWLPVIGPLSRHFRVIVPDMPGYGESEKPWAPYDRAYFTAWLAQFVDRVGVRDFRLVAHSLGGAVAIQYALEEASKISQLVLVNSAGLGRSSSKVPLYLAFRMMWNNLFPSSEGSAWFLRTQVLYDARTISQDLLDIEEYGRTVITRTGGKRVFWLGRGRAIKPFEVQELKRLAPPILIIWGAEDRNFPLSTAAAVAGIVPSGHLHVIEKARHLCYYDSPDQFNQILLAHLTGHRAEAR